MREALILLFGFVTVALNSFADKERRDWPSLTQKPFSSLPIRDVGLQPLLRTEDGKPITTVGQWRERSGQLRDAWQKHLGQQINKPSKLDVRVEKVEKLEGYTRKMISFHSGGNDRLLAYLLIPDDLKKGEKRPAMVVFHQTTNDTLKEPVGLGKKKSLALGLHLVKRGYVVLCPQCFIMKEGGPRAQAKAIAKRWPSWTGLGKMTFDASRCVDLLESLAFVDDKRIGCIGHSLGAKEVLYAMAFEPLYRVGVFNEGGIGLRMSNWTDPWYLTSKMKRHIPASEHHQLLALIAPRPILLLGGDSADGDASWTFVRIALPVYRLHKANERIGLINHRRKHSFPKQARRLAYDWIDHWLVHRPTRNEVGED